MERALRQEVVAFITKQSELPLMKLVVFNDSNPFDEVVSVSKTAESISEIELSIQDAFDALVRGVEAKAEGNDKNVMMDVIEGWKMEFDREIGFFKLIEESKFKNALVEAIRLEAPQLLEKCMEDLGGT